jgi:hypothetical protein
VNNLNAFELDGQKEMSVIRKVKSQEKGKLRETTFLEQIQTVLAVERELEGRWVIQREFYGEWRGIIIRPIIPHDPVSEPFPLTGTATYPTSGEAVDAMERLHERFPEIQMRVSPVEDDIQATRLWPHTGLEKSTYGDYPTWAELRGKCPGVIFA